MATSGSGPPASHATHATPKTSTPFVTSGRSTATGTVLRGSRNGSRSSARNVQRRYPYVRASPPAATGSMRTKNPPKVVPLQMPTSMFCGLPVTESTEPTLAPMASPSRYGVGRTRSGPRAASRTGVTTRQMVSLTKNADSSPPPTTVQVDEREPLDGDEEVCDREDDEPGGHISQLESSTPWAGVRSAYPSSVIRRSVQRTR